MFDNLFTVENLLNVLGTFAYLFGELFLLFIAISFFVALLQVWVSKDRIKRILSRPHKVTNAVLGAALGAVTPFCSCSTIPVLVGLFKSGAPFSGAISFLMTSPILNPAIIALLLVFFGPVPTLVYTVITFTFAVCVGLLLGFSRYIKNVAVKGGCCGGDEVTWENLKGTFWQKQAQACKYAFKDAIGLFKGVVGWLLLGAGIGAFIYGFVPTELLEGLAGADNLWAIPLAAVIGIPMYIRVETMIPIAGILMDKGVSAGIVAETPMLDLQYSEDSRAQVDLNCIMNELGEIIEIQGTGEERPFTLDEQRQLVELCEKGIRRLQTVQRAVLEG